MDYNLLIIEKIEDIRKIRPEYTFGQIIYGISTQLRKAGFKVEKHTDFLKIPSEQFYTAASRSLKAEGLEKLQNYEEILEERKNK